jgi:hypothetical protein
MLERLSTTERRKLCITLQKFNIIGGDLGARNNASSKCTPFINAFQKKKAWNLPKSSTNLSDFKTCFPSPQNVAISKLFFFPSWKCGDLVFFLEFSKMLASPCMFLWGTFQWIFVTKKKIKNKKLAALRLCVCLSWFKETGRLHSVPRSRVPTSPL